jgi:hypothetical protein
MLEVASEKLTERERECVKHFRQAQERGESFAEYCRAAGLKANEWHAVRHGMVQKGLLPGRVTGAKRRPTQQRRSGFIPVRVGPSGSADLSVPFPSLASTLSYQSYAPQQINKANIAPQGV